VGVNRRWLLIAANTLWPAQADQDANRLEARPDTLLDAKGKSMSPSMLISTLSSLRPS
jgi:hypothetical protein